ncbi:MAG: hypothetical protein RIQ81_791 [Pseudomonadota bacterium]|jgi:hypothetical protein
MTSLNDKANNLGRDHAADAIRRVVSIFCQRCASAQDALAIDDWEKFDEMFQLQRVAWLNLNALVDKFESVFGLSSCKSEVRFWLQPCKSASDSLRAEIAAKLAKVEAEGRAGARLKRHLSAFQAGSGRTENFLKGA